MSRVKLFTLCCLSTGIIALFVAMIMQNSDVMELQDHDFSTTIEQYEMVLVMFYAPWCPHCKRLEPKFEKAASSLMDENLPVRLAKIDCSGAGRKTCKSMNILGYPTLKIFKNGVLLKKYYGPREADGITQYLKQQFERSANYFPF